MRFEIPEPCDERWSSMRPRGEGRYCQRCEHVVLDLSTLTRREAEKRVAKVEGDYVCVRLAFDEEGGALFRPAPAPVRGLAGGLVLVAALAAGGCGEGEGAASSELVQEREPAALAPPESVPAPVAVQAEAPPELPPPELPPPELCGLVPEDGAVTPSAEQRERTRRKQRDRTPPIRHMILGRMPIHPLPMW